MERNLLPSCVLVIGHGSSNKIKTQDNAKEGLENNTGALGSGQCAEVKPTERLCKGLKRTIGRRHLWNPREVEQLVQDEWDKLAADKYRSLTKGEVHPFSNLDILCQLGF